MHQPTYRDPTRGRYSMPWVRLHATKAYHDMPSLLSNFPGIKAIFNLVPSLLAQLQDYALDLAEDEFLNISAKPANELTQDDKEFILRNFFNCNWETMIKPYPRYWQLLFKRGMVFDERKIREATSHFNTEDFLDLQVWFNLTWFGYSARKKKPACYLFRKGKFFTENEKNVVFGMQKEIIRNIIPLYAGLAKERQIEITSSPFYHPILPLLIDSDLAKRPVPEVHLPQRFHFPEDASWQVAEALDFHEKVFGQRPLGLWPSEGSVCPELIPIMSGLGIRWAAADEGILFNSVNGYRGGDALYYPYVVEHEGAKVNMIFRDHEMSDLFGFVYHRNPPQQAADDFISRLYNVRAKRQRGKNPLLLSIILDGENPWEYYSGGGEAFLTELYERLLKNADFKTTTVSDYLEEFPPGQSISSLYTGSWINQNFDIWIGGEEENEAWNVLGETRAFLDTTLRERQDLPDEVKSKAWEALHTAEGSDWFWWYGDHFSSAYSFEFDRLFREYLLEVYKVLGSKAPENLLRPIKQIKKVAPVREPTGFIHPVLDGRETQFFEWSGAGYFEARPASGAMYQEQGSITAIYYGFDVDNLYFRFDSGEKEFSRWPAEKEIRLYFLNNRAYFLVFVPMPKEKDRCYRLYRGRADNYELVGEFDSIFVGKFIELAASIKDLGFEAGEAVRFMVEITGKGMVQERYPSVGYLAIIVPDENFERIYWQV